MTQHWLRSVLLLAFVCGAVGCGVVKPNTGSKRPGVAERPPQTGTNLPRDLMRRTAKREVTATPSKPKRKREATATPSEPKARREQRPANREVDEDFVTRGGFR